MLQPSRRKYRKEQKGRNTGLASRGTHVSFGEFGLKATGRGRPDRASDRSRSSRHQPSHQAWRPYLDPYFPGQADLAKAGRSPYGNGKGNPEYWVAEIQPGKVLYEMEGVSEELARARRSAWPLPSCRSRPRSSRVISVLKEY